MKITINQKKTITEMKAVEILRHTIIPTWCGGEVCAICEEYICDDSLIVFEVPYHLEYAHESCFNKLQQGEV